MDCRSAARARHAASHFDAFDHIGNRGIPLMHLSFSALMAPPGLSVAVYAKPKRIQRLSQWINIFASVLVLQNVRVHTCE